ncbi:asparagine synthase-related protein [Persicitalea jodogahamensis]|uniref:asparagine synthase (glutamine-hydrolyzing) n=1 Tax=Persicitalea jodogahamensis TaxID=402147 RepID=A0A8J3D4X8_9BACT|nr:asparagine synthase-related protein [Persicitalea jodogahamensis]GHB73941.1 asparagine synthetase B [Persicitalea jodogahamensis]
MHTPCLIAPHFSGLIHFGATDSDTNPGTLESSSGQRVNFAGGHVEVSTPESFLIDSDLIIVADTRLHNEREVQTLLALDRRVSPAELLAHAYRQWGEGLSKYLSGEFVYVIWDRKADQLVVSRDRFGFKTLYYDYQPDSHFAFANRISYLPTFKASSDSIDHVKVKNFLLPETSYRSFEDRTFYRNVKAALPAHNLTIQAGEKAQHCYWKVDPARYRSISREEEYIELFRDYFTDSVRKSTAGFDSVGAHLSGGIDSSSVACVAHQLAGPIATFYINPELPSTDESQFVRVVREKIQSRHFEGHPASDVYGSVALLSRLFDRPEHFPLPSGFHFAAADQIQLAGCDVVLTGHDGDSVVGHGSELIQAYRDAENWPALKQTINQYAEQRDLSHLDPGWLQMPASEKQKRYAQHYLNGELWSLLKKKDLGKFLKTARALSFEYGYSYQNFLNSGFEKMTSRLKFPTPGNILTPEFAATFEHGEACMNADSLFDELSADYTDQFREITNKSYVDATEQLRHIGLHYGHHYAHPFFDEKLVELSLAIPERIKFGDGKGRDTIRRALKDILPQEILNRGNKTSFSEYGLLSFQILHLQTKSIFNNGHLLWDFVDKKKFDKVVEIVFNTAIPLRQKSRYYSLASKALFLGVWLEEMKSHEKN